VSSGQSTLEKRDFRLILADTFNEIIDKMRVLKQLVFLAVLMVSASSCSFINKLLGKGGGAPTAEDPGEMSTATGLSFNMDPEMDTATTAGYLIRPFSGQPDGPNLRFIEGGRTVLGTFEEDLLNAGDHVERTVSVASFFHG